MSKKIWVSVIVIIGVAATLFTWAYSRNSQTQVQKVEEGQTSTVSETVVPTAPSPAVSPKTEQVSSQPEQTPAKTVSAPKTPTASPQATASSNLLEASRYTRTNLGLSIRVPKGFIASTTTDTATTSGVSIHRKDDKTEPPEIEIHAGRYSNDDEVTDTIAKVGKDGFINQVIELAKQSYNNYSVISTKKVTIQGKVFYQINATYLGSTSDREVTQQLHYLITDRSFFGIITEGYTPLFNQYKDALTQSVESVIITE